MVTPVLWGEFLVNKELMQGDQFSAQLHALANGRFVAVWQNVTNPGPDEVSAIYMQNFYAGAVPQGEPVQINTTLTGTHSNPIVTTLSDGRIVYIWEHGEADGTLDSLRARIFNADGTAYDRNGDAEGGTEDFVIASGEAQSFVEPRVAALPGGGFVVSYNIGPSDFSDSDIGATVVRPDGSSFTLDVNTNTADGYQSNASVVGLGDGRFATFFTSEVAEGQPEKLFLRICPSDNIGDPVPGEEIELSSSVAYGSTPTAVALTGGRFVVSWTNQNADGTLNVVAQVYTSAGAANGPLITVNKLTAGDQHSPSITALAGGGFAIAYQDEEVTGVPQVRVAIFDKNQNRVVDDIAASSTLTGPGMRGTPKLIELKDGRLIVAWDETGRSDDDVGIRGQVIDARFEGINYTVTEDGDLPIGTQFGDTITGSSRPEYIDGGHGDDALNGGGGNDVMIGNVGADRMDGGAGDDTYHVDSAGDVIVDASGIDTVITTISYTLAGNLENLRANSADAINLTGNGLNNTITGNEAANVIDGGAGADVMNGGGGDDTYFVDNAGDTITDTSGIDTVRTTVGYALGADLEHLIAEGGAGIGLTGNALNNTIIGNGGANKLYGDAGDDILSGNGGNDVLFGGFGNDMLTGGAGKDKFVFNTLPNKAANLDRIADFKAKDDDIYLDNAIFKKLGKKGSEFKPAKLNKKFFTLGKKAKDKNDYLVYDKKKGALYYDADGSNKKIKPIEIAKFDNKAKMTVADFFVI